MKIKTLYLFHCINCQANVYLPYNTPRMTYKCLKCGSEALLHTGESKVVKDKQNEI